LQCASDMSLLKSAILAFAMTTTACAGPQGGFVDDEEQGVSSARCASTPEPGPATVRRLTRFEWDNSVRDLLGDDSQVAKSFVQEEVAYGFANNAEALSVSPVLAEQYMDAAETVADTAVARLDKILPCDPVAIGENACAFTFIDRFAARAYRRPATADEIKRLRAVYDKARVDGDFATGIRWVIEVILQSPQFLYRIEPSIAETPQAKVVAVTGYEMASRLSYFLWGTSPDDVLLAAAQTGHLLSETDIAAQAKRMIADPRARQSVANFHAQWLQLDAIDTANKSSEVFPEFDDHVRRSLKRETELFVESVFWGDGRLETLMTAPYTFVDERLAIFYGYAMPNTTAFLKAYFPRGRRGGLLTQGAILAVHAKANQTSPVARGKFVRERILCHELTPPPPTVDTTPPVVDPSKTTRERFAMHTKNSMCAGCHKYTDPIGFAFEHYDAVGRYRETENGLAIDSTATLTDTLDVDGPIDGAIDLGSRLARSEQVRACVVKQWFRYAYGRKETDADTCTLATLNKRFAAKNHDMRELLVALTQADPFRFRRVEGASP